MIKALLKKQLSAFKYSLFQGKKPGKPRKAGATVGLGILLVISYLSIMFLFFGMATQMITSLGGTDLDYLPFAFLSALAFLVSLFVTGFYAGSALYGAKDNELLLSMPIPPLKILLVRMISVYLMSLASTSIVLVPTIIAYFVFAVPTVAAYVFCILNIFIFPLFSAFCSCVLGFIISVITAKVRRKSFITAVLTMLFLVVYYVFYFNMQKIIKSVIENGEIFAERIKTYGFVFYSFAKSCVGSVLQMILFLCGTVVLYGLLCLVLSKTFLSVAMGEKASKKRGKKEQTKAIKAKSQSVGAALLKRELRRFAASPAYLTNVGLGIVLMLAAAVCVFVFNNKINTSIGMMQNTMPPKIAAAVPDLFRAAIAVLICIISSTVYFTASSVSTEGKKLWILSTAPIGAKKIFRAKINAHLLLCGIPAAVLSLSSAIAFGYGIKSALVQLVFCLGFVYLSAVLGLLLNLKMPNLDWTNETVPIKQGAPVLIAFFGGWLVSVIIGIGAYLTRIIIPTDYYLLFFGALFIAAALIINSYLSKNGEKLFLNL